jgi:pimeloyl-ACP methyl ester carboxylesterase
MHLIPNAGHFVMEDAPGEVAGVLTRFFSGDGTSS